ncbi:biotin synthase BioB [Clostridium sporogenes]|uniref:biotin synthase BioB n=1 Tax=Clostridium sporogenes TaxID=1509 RepID=UPI00024BA98C|nr:biotin synthase BioB [Clostridium sporogenes]EHN13320.1 biotin synthase [Clostridium sporogenes PA 3679]MCW6105371.1 biotin synthase BioB [Clostridium sporogenes]MDU4597335.1 biotin synthase BioB [Clostridium sporogenes]NFF66736.1 biotin synthase BioB [Clostridium sporogenes]NFF99488.1 biotin synthase BioB [Clostridium sporogenes]
MSNIIKYKKKILNGDLLTKEEVEELLEEDTIDLAVAANEIRESLCGNKFDLCTIINGKSGRCQENCKYCAQSAHFNTDIIEYNILHSNKIINSAISNYNKGVHRFSVVTSGRALNNNEVDTLCKTYSKLKETCPIGLCASHGLLKYEDLKRLKDFGVMRYHNNLETSRKFFTKICSTHTYDDKIETIKNAKKAGLEICSGGIIGLGETMEDRIDMAFTLRGLSIESVPVNILNPIKGTPLENQEILSYEEVIKTLAIFRFILPTVQIRLAGGRALLGDKGKKALMSGVNGAISEDMLTTLGIETSEDIKMIKNLGFEV